MTNTQRLIEALAHAEQAGQRAIEFMVGRCTGNGPSVVAALRRRGYIVTKVPAGGVACYRLHRDAPLPTDEPTEAQWLAALGPCGK